ncbi:MAG TPA: 50S ribosomal protein L9 [Candidatus Paceibacterota bacterium]|nr:50S ribosomal protein L9 [Candidatus Paceibacterota bacterium]
MKVILLKGVSKLGKKDDIVEVSDGYAHNALFPQKAAVSATPEAVARLKKRQAGEQSGKEIQHELLGKALEMLKEKQVTMHVRANAQGHLFAKITATDITALLLREHRLSLEPKVLQLAEPIKETGTYSIPVSFDSFNGSLTLTVAAL